MSDPVNEVKDAVAAAPANVAAAAVDGAVKGVETAIAGTAQKVKDAVSTAVIEDGAKAGIDVHSILDRVKADLLKISQWPAHIVAEIEAAVERHRP